MNIIQAEKAVLGGLMLNNKYWEEINSSYFSSIPNKILYDTMKHLFKAGKPIDFITLSEELYKQDKLDDIGGLSYLYSIYKNTPVNNMKAYADIIKKNAQIIFIDRIYYDIKTKINNPKNIVDLFNENLEEIKTNYNKNLFTGLNTGYDALNQITLGLQKSDLIIIAARPSMGKTTLALNLCENVSILQDKPVLIFSLEMPERQILKRILSSLTILEQEKIKMNKFSRSEWVRLTNTFKKLAQRKNIFIDDSSNITPSELRYKAKKIYKENGLSLILVDYLQLMKLTKKNSKKNNRNLEITEITRALKSLAKELHVPIIAISQLNRYLEQRTDKRPMNSDLRESGAIEQDADLILFIYRDEIYNQNSQMKGIAEIIIGKHRNGPRGRFFLRFNEKYARFENYDDYDEFDDYDEY